MRIKKTIIPKETLEEIQPYIPVQKPPLTHDNKILFINRPISASDIHGTKQQKMGSIMQPLQHGQEREMAVLFDKTHNPFASVYGQRKTILYDMDNFTNDLPPQKMTDYNLVHTHDWGYGVPFPAPNDLCHQFRQNINGRIGNSGVAGDTGVVIYNFKDKCKNLTHPSEPRDIIDTYEDIVERGGENNIIGKYPYDYDRKKAAITALKNSGTNIEYFPYPNPLFKARKSKKNIPKLKTKSKLLKPINIITQKPTQKKSEILFKMPKINIGLKSNFKINLNLNMDKFVLPLVKKKKK